MFLEVGDPLHRPNPPPYSVAEVRSAVVMHAEVRNEVWFQPYTGFSGDQKDSRYHPAPWEGGS